MLMSDSKVWYFLSWKLKVIGCGIACFSVDEKRNFISDALLWNRKLTKRIFLAKIVCLPSYKKVQNRVRK